MLKADNTDEVLRSMPGKSFQPFVEESSAHGHVSAEPVNVEFKIAYVIFYDLSCFLQKGTVSIIGHGRLYRHFFDGLVCRKGMLQGNLCIVLP